jgi:hypothetical protein
VSWWAAITDFSYSSCPIYYHARCGMEAAIRLWGINALSPLIRRHVANKANGSCDWNYHYDTRATRRETDTIFVKSCIKGAKAFYFAVLVRRMALSFTNGRRFPTYKRHTMKLPQPVFYRVTRPQWSSSFIMVLIFLSFRNSLATVIIMDDWILTRFRITWNKYRRSSSGFIVAVTFIWISK